MKSNLELYNRVREVPDEAKRAISAGRLKGKTDINPMFRIQALTREFGPAGKGWYTDSERWTEDVNGERILYIKTRLFTRDPETGDWNAPIEGFGGAMICAREKSGLFADDDAAKKAYTDSLSQACRSLGIGADVYWQQDASKYATEQQAQQTKASVLAYLDTLTSPEQTAEFWKTYSPYYGGDPDFRKAFTQHQQQIQDGPRKN